MFFIVLPSFWHIRMIKISNFDPWRFEENHAKLSMLQWKKQNFLNPSYCLSIAALHPTPGTAPLPMPVTTVKRCLVESFHVASKPTKSKATETLENLHIVLNSKASFINFRASLNFLHALSLAVLFHLPHLSLRSIFPCWVRCIGIATET